MSEDLIAGIDGGQTSTAAAVALAGGRVVGRGTGPPADLVGEPRGASLRQNLALTSALEAALADAGLGRETPLAALVAGLTGHDTGTPAPFAFDNARAQRFVHDTVIAHAGALGGDAGILVLAGTGSVALGNAAPNEPYVRAGGWGYFFGDEGGALWVARQAVAIAMSEEDRGRRSVLAREALDFFELPDLRAVQHAFAHGELTRAELAAFAARVLALADGGPSIEAGPRHVRSAAAAALVELVATVDERLTPGERPTGGDARNHAAQRRVSYAGGMFASDGLRRVFESMLRARLPSASLTAPVGDPLAGAIALARDLARSSAIRADAREDSRT